MNVIKHVRMRDGMRVIIHLNAIELADINGSLKQLAKHRLHRITQMVENGAKIDDPNIMQAQVAYGRVESMITKIQDFVEGENDTARDSEAS